MRSKRTIRTRRQTTKHLQRLELCLEYLERRDLLSFGSLVQAGLSQTPFTNTSDINGQSGTVTLNSEVEPYVAVDPTNPRHIVGVWQQDRWDNGGARGIVAGVSTDGGNTWSDVTLPGSSVVSGGNVLRISDPWVSIGPDGTVYASYLEVNDPDVANPAGLFISTSTDGGYTWDTPTAAITNSGDTNLFDDKDSITADPYTPGEAYVVWDRLNFSENIGPAMFSRTTDGGQTWSTPVQIVNPANGQTIANQIVVLPGDVLVDMCISIDYSTNDSTIEVMRSTDQGATWSAPITVNSYEDIGVTDPNNGAAVRAGGDIPMIATNPVNGSIDIVWQDGRFSNFAHDDIAMSMSTDGGLSWSDPIKVNQTPASIPAADAQAFMPSVAVEANGLVAVSYYDFGNNTGSGPTLTDYWVAFANPAQPNFTFGSEQRLTDTSFNMQLAPNAEGEFLGDYEALVAGGDTTNTFSAFFAQTVSTTTPTTIFYRGIVPPNTLSLTNFTPPTNAVEGKRTGGTLATFSDASPDPNINTYTAVVNWGDGDTDTLTAANGGIVSNGGGSFSVVDTHTYAVESSGESFNVQIADNGGGSAGSTATVAVADAPLTASGVTLDVGVNAAITGVTVATFTDADPNGKASYYTATVNWGDGDTTASVSVSADPHVAGQFDVIASKSHPYASAGTFPITVVIDDFGGATATANSKAIVSSPTITVTGSNFTATEGAAFSGDLATIVDTNKNEPVSYYTASINWGDGTTSTGTIAAGTSKGHFKVSGTHAYVEFGTYTVVVTVTEGSGAFASGSLTAKVKDAPLSGSATSFSAVKNQAFNGQVATFTDGNPQGVLSDYSATIAWGDGHSSTATVSADPSGGYQVQGTHTYAKTGTFTFTVTISDVGGSKLSVKGTATVGAGAAVVVGGGDSSDAVFAAGNADHAFALAVDGSAFEYGAATGWLSLGNAD